MKIGADLYAKYRVGWLEGVKGARQCVEVFFV